MQGEIVLSFFDFKNGSKYVDAQKDPSKLKGLTRNDVTQVTDACDVYWKRDADGIFRGKTTEDCIVIDHITGSSIRIEDNTELGPDYVSIHERGFDVKTGAKIFGNPTPDVLNRTDREARLFSGYVAVETSPGKFGLMANVSIWDVGQIVPVVIDGKKTKFSIELAYCTYPNGDNVLKVAVHEEGFVDQGLVRPVA